MKGVVYAVSGGFLVSDHYHNRYPPVYVVKITVNNIVALRVVFAEQETAGRMYWDRDSNHLQTNDNDMEEIKTLARNYARNQTGWALQHPELPGYDPP